jgi:D-3-phosphoglycerate dehydrogenase
MKGRIAVTPRSMSEAGHPSLARLSESGYEIVFPSPGRQPGEAELLEHLPGCVGYLAGVEPVSRRVLEASPTLRVISRNGVGVDNVDLEAAAAFGIAVELAAGANARGVAELALGLMLDGLRHVSWSDGVMRDGEWRRRKGREALGRTIGIVGFGAIGRTLAQFCLALGMRVVAYDPFVNATEALDGRVRMVDLADLLSAADVVSLHCPPSPVPLIDAAAIARMRHGTVLVNTARAELVDDDAVLAALEDGTLSAYATDVYRTEPPDASALLAHPHVILTPHIGGFTDESVERASAMAVENLLRRLEGPA